MSIDAIKELRELTGLSFNEIRMALNEANGDKKKALELLKAKGASIAEKKSSRSTDEGVVEAYVHSNKKVGAIIELVCETDFVARNPLFIEIAHDIAMHVVAMSPASIEELLEQPYVKDASRTINQILVDAVAKLGENIKIERFERLVI